MDVNDTSILFPSICLPADSLRGFPQKYETCLILVDRQRSSSFSLSLSTIDGRTINEAGSIIEVTVKNPSQHFAVKSVEGWDTVRRRARFELDPRGIPFSISRSIEITFSLLCLSVFRRGRKGGRGGCCIGRACKRGPETELNVAHG